ncbi:MAG: polymer-forming cytoskeletal protein [Nitrosomonas sp.]|nr:polymer-forming cytoskeletal protein [Nitrosomonas sp.]MDP1951852.1 polymer-forming cytoskeletal protein [Nitrosomonas sp.]
MFGRKKKKKLHDHIDSLIGSNTHIEGNINFNGGLRVDGHICGNILATGDEHSTLVLSEQGNIEGKIQAPNVVINGTVTGPVHADEYLELQSKAKVFGDVYYGSVEIQLGALIEGKLIHLNNLQPEKLVTLIPVTSD